mmetsp:Transcript_52501/g.122849  ORF Transcript_52501/g.122849 Transcript_52501/m.122849 type:complete len:592 (+) Transcript_52501:86-1861(+)
MEQKTPLATRLSPDRVSQAARRPFLDARVKHQSTSPRALAKALDEIPVVGPSEHLITDNLRYSADSSLHSGAPTPLQPDDSVLEMLLGSPAMLRGKWRTHAADVLSSQGDCRRQIDTEDPLKENSLPHMRCTNPQCITAHESAMVILEMKTQHLDAALKECRDVARKAARADSESHQLRTQVEEQARVISAMEQLLGVALSKHPKLFEDISSLDDRSLMALQNLNRATTGTGSCSSPRASDPDSKPNSARAGSQPRRLPKAVSSPTLQSCPSSRSCIGEKTEVVIREPVVNRLKTEDIRGGRASPRIRRFNEVNASVSKDDLDRQRRRSVVSSDVSCAGSARVPSQPAVCRERSLSRSITPPPRLPSVGPARYGPVAQAIAPCRGATPTRRSAVAAALPQTRAVPDAPRHSMPAAFVPPLLTPSAAGTCSSAAPVLVRTWGGPAQQTSARDGHPSQPCRGFDNAPVVSATSCRTPSQAPHQDGAARRGRSASPVVVVTPNRSVSPQARQHSQTPCAAQGLPHTAPPQATTLSARTSFGAHGHAAATHQLGQGKVEVQSAQRHVGAAACPAPAPAPARQVHVPAMVGIRSAI